MNWWDKGYEAKQQQDRERREQEAKERQEKAEKRLESDLRFAFFDGNSNATEADFKRLLPTLRDDKLKRKTVATDRAAKRAQFARAKRNF